MIAHEFELLVEMLPQVVVHNGWSSIVHYYGVVWAIQIHTRQSIKCREQKVRWTVDK